MIIMKFSWVLVGSKYWQLNSTLICFWISYKIFYENWNILFTLAILYQALAKSYCFSVELLAEKAEAEQDGLKALPRVLVVIQIQFGYRTTSLGTPWDKENKSYNIYFYVLKVLWSSQAHSPKYFVYVLGEYYWIIIKL